MKPSGSIGKSSSASAINTKSKKSSKDREKRKSASFPEKIESNSSDKGSPNKDGSSRKYAGIGPESILTYTEQSAFEHLSEDVCYGLAEDISYKLRYVIHDALIKARLSGRNHILSTDIDSTFNDLNIEKVYGARAAPNWISFGDHSLYYLDDPVVNLIELAEQPCSYTQPGDVIINKKWLPDTKDTEPMRNYFKTMCLAVVSSSQEVCEFALKDIKQNHHIGPIAEWFYHFGYFLLSKDITYDCLTLSALGLIKVLEQNSVATLSVSEKQLKLLVRLLLQRLLRSQTNVEVLKPMCSMLAMLCERLPLRELVVAKLNQKIPEIKDNFLLPIVSIVNTFGIDTIFEIFIPHMEYILTSIQQDYNAELISAVLQTYSILRRNCDHTERLDALFYEVFGDGICPIWEVVPVKGPERSESNWLQIKIQLFRTRRKIYHDRIQNQMNARAVFPDYCDLTEDNSKIDIVKVAQMIEKPGIRFQIKKIVQKKTVFPLITDSDLRNSLCIYGTDDINPDISFLSELINPQPNYVLIGKRTLLLSGMKSYKSQPSNKNYCCDHSLMFYNL